MPLPPLPAPRQEKKQKTKTKQNKKQINKNEMGHSQQRSVEVYCRPVYIAVCSCLGLSRLNPVPLPSPSRPPPLPPLAKKNKTNKTKNINKNEMGDSQRRSLEVYCRPVYIAVCSCLGLSRLNPVPPHPPTPTQIKTNKTKQNEKQINKNEMGDSTA